MGGRLRRNPHDPDTQPKFVNDLPAMPVLDAREGGSLALDIVQGEQWMGLVDADCTSLVTTIWGYALPDAAPTFPGVSILAESGVPVDITFRNLLPTGAGLLPFDASIADPMVAQAIADGYWPLVTHLHGAHTGAPSDGFPDAWYTQGEAEIGPDFTSATNHYDNSQQAATLWYHDHVDTITRLDMYAGLSGFYNLGDATEQGLIGSGVLPGGDYELNISISDRSFTADGQLYLPGGDPGDPVPGPIDPETGEHATVSDSLSADFDGDFPTILPEFFGDTILANGMAWPKQGLAPTQYLLHLLDNSDSRFYVLHFDNPWVKVTLVGSDGGLLPEAKTVIAGDGVDHPDQFLLLGPADRNDVVVDFSDPHLLGQHVTLLNSGPAFDPINGINPDGTLPEGIQAADPDDGVGQVMRFDVAAYSPGCLPTASVTDGTLLEPNAEDPMPAPDHVRKLGLFEVEDAFGHVTPELGPAEATTDIDGNPVAFGPLPFSAPVTETPRLGSTEEWDIFNFTEDAHPIHIHLVQFAVLGRQEISFEDADGDGTPDDLRGTSEVTAGMDPSNDDVLLGDDVALSAEDLGRQDTVIVAPGTMVRLLMTFDKPGEFVWHCHIISHEDNSMMRPFAVTGGDDLFA